jgi:hypothetical protein
MIYHRKKQRQQRTKTKALAAVRQRLAISWLTPAARPARFALRAARGYLEPMRMEDKSGLLGDLAGQGRDLLALELHDIAAGQADQVAVVGTIGIVRIVVLKIFAKVNFLD